MSNTNLPQYTFLSWYRKGLVNYINTVDTPGTTGPQGMPSITFELELNDLQTATVQQDIDIIGPGHIAGLNDKAIIKTFPQNGVKNAEYTNLAYLEFYEEDFPWRYTPAQADGNRLRPWVTLLVLKEGEFIINYGAASPLPYIDIPSTIGDAATPNPALDIPSDNIWAWAHVQINRALQTDPNDPSKHDDLTDEIDHMISSNPDIALSRLVCPRKLDAETNYTAFLIPSFEVGRLAGLGQDPSTTDVLSPSWTSSDLASGNKQMPFYYSWDFETGVDGDFESLVKKLEAKTVESLPQRTLNIESLATHFQTEITTNSPQNTATTKTLELGSALMPQIFTLDTWPNASNADGVVQNEIINDLNQNLGSIDASTTQDPIVNIPPTYGQHYVNNVNLSNPDWLAQSNTTPRDRAITALGAALVKKHQDTLMTHAWEKLGQVQEINKKIYQAQLGKEVNSQIFTKQLETKTDEEFIAQTGNLQKKILDSNNATPTTLARQIKTSNLDASATNSGFIKARRTGGKVEKKLAKQAKAFTANNQRPLVNEQLVFKLNKNQNFTEIQGSAPKASPYARAEDQSSFAALSNVTSNVHSNKAELDVTATKNTLSNALHPTNVLPKKVHHHIKLNNSNGHELTIPASDTIAPILAAPKIELPIYQYLVDVSQDFIIPDIKDLGNNFVALFEVDQSFVEKVMVGANHEMGKELLWRGYPTDQKGTCFNYFWDTRDNPNNSTPLEDITDIHTWGTSTLGTHNPNNPNITALVIKGDLLQAYPNTVIYAHKGIYAPNVTAPTNTLSNAPIHSNLPSLPTPITTTGSDRLLDSNISDQTLRYPIFQARLSPNVLVLGFDLGVDELLGRTAPNQNPTLPGWFFMFKERPGEPRFGLDDAGSTPTLNTWDDLAWQHLSTNYVDLSAPLIPTTLPRVNWNSDAASMAHILYQSPILMGLHASKVINS